MTEAEFMAVIRSVRESDDPVSLTDPLEATSLDSLDLLHLWCALETVTGRELTQQKFHPKVTLQQIFRMVNP